MSTGHIHSKNRRVKQSVFTLFGPVDKADLNDRRAYPVTHGPSGRVDKEMVRAVMNIDGGDAWKD
jgi:hypothetical protein